MSLDVKKLQAQIDAENDEAREITVRGLANEDLIASQTLQMQYKIYDRLGDLIMLQARGIR